jgi:hypothetical protein
LNAIGLTEIPRLLPRERRNMTLLDEKTVERLAEAAHEVWMEAKLRDGWTHGPKTDKSRKIHSCLVPYYQLSEADKESDRDLVRGMSKILAAAGYRMVEAIQNGED